MILVSQYTNLVDAHVFDAGVIACKLSDSVEYPALPQRLGCCHIRIISDITFL